MFSLRFVSKTSIARTRSVVLLPQQSFASSSLLANNNIVGSSLITSATTAHTPVVQRNNHHPRIVHPYRSFASKPNMTEIQKQVELLNRHGVIPDVLEPFQPTSVLDIWWGDFEHVNYGNEITPTRAAHPPTKITWETEPGALYTLCKTDPDAPSRQNPKFREWHHWLVVNIPGNDIAKGDTLSQYIGCGPPEGTGNHRYVYVVYKQHGHIHPDEKRLPGNSGADRGKFSIQKFAKKYHLGHPIAANFFLASYDDYVPKLYAKLSG